MERMSLSIPKTQCKDKRINTLTELIFGIRNVMSNI